MKKAIALLLTMGLVLGTTACGSAKQEEPAAAASSATASSAVEETEEAVQEEPAAEDTAALDLVILKEADDNMINNYSLIAVNPDAPFVDADGNTVSDVSVNTDGAEALIQWMLKQETLDLASGYGMEEYGQQLFYAKEDAPVYDGEIAQATEETKTIRLSTTTSVNDSGLLGYLLPIFEEEYGYTVEVQSAGTGKAIAAAMDGNADLIFVHSKSQEEAFVEGGFAKIVTGFETERITLLYNYFVLCGPSADPVGAANTDSVLDAFKAIADQKQTFISRGDGSGTHTKELSLWPEELGITAEPESFADYTDWYISANAGMGACLVMANEMGGYILTDKATFLTFEANGGVIE